MRRRNAASGLALLALVVASAIPVLAQSDGERQALRTQVEQRFTVLLLREGVVLEPKRGSDIRAIQVAGGDITIEGDPATGAELRRRLGDDADLVIRLSYFSASDQRALFAREPAAVRPNDGPAVDDSRPSRPARPPRSSRSSRLGDRVRIGEAVQVNEGEVVKDVVAIGGGARIDGQVTGDVVAIGGDLDLGPHADVDGDVTVVGGVMRRDAAARVGGTINDVDWGDLNWVPGKFGRWHWPGAGFLVNSAMGSLFALVTTVSRLAILCLLASVVLVFGRGYVERVGSRAAAEPVKSGLVGFVIQLLFFPVLLVTVVVMIVTIIGIPLLALVPFALFALALLLLLGFTAVAFDVGQIATARLGWREQSPYLIAAIGVIVTLSPVLVGRLVGLAGGVLLPFAWALLGVGFMIEYVAWTVGLGAVALARFDRKTPVLPAA